MDPKYLILKRKRSEVRVSANPVCVYGWNSCGIQGIDGADIGIILYNNCFVGSNRRWQGWGISRSNEIEKFWEVTEQLEWR